MTPRSPSTRRVDLGERRWPLVAALAAVFLGAIDLTVIATVLPRMVFDLHINTADIDRYVWVVDAYFLAYIVSIPLMGRISDRLGRAAAFEIALAIFLAGSVWSATAGDLRELIAARAVQGAGGGALLPVTLALVGDLLPPGRRLTALGVVGAVDTLGWVLGPLWGAATVGAAPGDEPWRWVFWINLPIGLLVAVAIAFAGRRTRELRSAAIGLRGLDLPGTILLGGGLLLVNLGLSAGGEVGLTQGSAMRALGGTKNPLAGQLIPLIAGGLLLLALFFLWERRVTHPILSPRLFGARPFLTGVLANFLVGAALIVAVVDVPVVVALLVDQDRISTVSAYLLAPFTISMAALSFAGGLAAKRYGERRTAVLGLLLVVAGYVALWFGLREDHYLRMIPGLLVAGMGFGLVVAPIAAQVIDSASEEDRGIAAAFTILFRLLGMTIGISALTAIGVHRLQTLTGRLEPVVQQPGETTAEFFVRQTQFIEDYAVPLSLKVVRETFLIAAVLAALAMIPMRSLRTRTLTEASVDEETTARPTQPAAERRRATASATDTSGP
jgi:MFS family permease